MHPATRKRALDMLQALMIPRCASWVTERASSFCIFRFAAECHPSGLCHYIPLQQLFSCAFFLLFTCFTFSPLADLFLSLLHLLQNLSGLFVNCFCLLIALSLNGKPFTPPLHCCCPACHYPLFLTCLTKRLQTKRLQFYASLGTTFYCKRALLAHFCLAGFPYFSRFWSLP